eukprot:2307606-Pyramimonas_sp.AAC.1
MASARWHPKRSRRNHTAEDGYLRRGAGVRHWLPGGYSRYHVASSDEAVGCFGCRAHRGVGVHHRVRQALHQCHPVEARCGGLSRLRVGRHAYERSHRNGEEGERD